MRFPHLSLFSVAAFSMVAAGCTVPSGSTEEDANPEPNRIGHERLMLTDHARAPRSASPTTESAATSSKTLTYYGGPVVESIVVFPVYWTSTVANQANLDAFYAAIAETSFLSQYSTSSPKQTIGAGSFGGSHVDSQTATKVTDAQVQQFLTSLFDNGALPVPTGDSYYPVHFPAGVKITASDGSQSCVQFCAYHGTYAYNGQNVYYGVLPDLSQSGCNGGCGGSTVFNNSTSVASHELAETVTDPAVGLATVYGPPLGWYNETYGEIADLCNGQQATATLGDGHTYTVQKLWSNSSKACVTPTFTNAYTPTASASNVAIAGNPYPGATITGSYTFHDTAGLSELGSTYQWYTVAGGNRTAIAGATSQTYALADADIDAVLQFCVIPSDSHGAGAQVCSGKVTVPGIVWYSQPNWVGTATPETVTNGACVNMSDLGLVGATQSVVLYGNPTTTATLDLYTGSNCTGALYVRTSGVNTSHNINLGTVGIGTGTLSYRVSW